MAVVVCSSVTTAKRRITQITPDDSSFSAGKISTNIRKLGAPNVGGIDYNRRLCVSVCVHTIILERNDHILGKLVRLDS